MTTQPPCRSTPLQVVQTDEPASDRLVEDGVFSTSGLAIDFTTHRCGTRTISVKRLHCCRRSDQRLRAISSRVLEAMPHCCIVAVNATGFDGVDIDRATELGIVITNVADYCSDEVADHALALILSLARRIPELTRSVRAGEWNYEAAGRPTRLGNQTLGVIGFGRIGSRVALRARSFGLQVVAHDPYVSDERMRVVGAEKVSLQEALASDFVSLHCCLTPETRLLINEQTLSAMRSRRLSRQHLARFLCRHRRPGAGAGVWRHRRGSAGRGRARAPASRTSSTRCRTSRSRPTLRFFRSNHSKSSAVAPACRLSLRFAERLLNASSILKCSNSRSVESTVGLSSREMQDDQ